MMKNLMATAFFLLVFLANSLPLQAMMECQDDSVTEVTPQTNYAKLKPSKLLKHAKRGDEGARQYLIKKLTTLFVNDELVKVFSQKIVKLPQLLKHIQSEAEASNPLAQFCLGFMYFNGYGVSQDYGQAMELYGKAATQGLAIAQSNLACMYQRGKGVPQDSRQAVEWYRKAAEQGLAEAQDSLGELYFNGLGDPAEGYRQGMELYQKAAEQGYKHAQNMLAFLYSNACGLPKDTAKAIQWEKMNGRKSNTPPLFE